MKARPAKTYCICASLTLGVALSGALDARGHDDFYLKHNLVSDGFVSA